MELTMRTVVMMLILLIATFVFASIMLGWGSQTSSLINEVITPFLDMIVGR